MLKRMLATLWQWWEQQWDIPFLVEMDPQPSKTLAEIWHEKTLDEIWREHGNA